MGSLAGVRFRNYSHLQTLTKDILYLKIGFNSYVDEKNDYYKFLCALLDRHPEKQTKISGKVKGFRTYRNVLNKRSMGLNVISENGDDEQSFSWKVCCNAVPRFNIRNAFTNACRQAVKFQIYDFKLNNAMVCVLCNSEKDVEIDHHGEYEFKDIIKHFLTMYNMPKYYDKDSVTKQCIFREEDNQLKKDFQDLHKRFAVLQPLCRFCHSTKTFSPKLPLPTNEPITIVYN